MQFSLVASLVFSVAAAGPQVRRRDSANWPAYWVPAAKVASFDAPASLADKPALDVAQLRSLSLDHAQNNLSMGEGDTIDITAAHLDANGIYHCYMQKSLNGIPIENSVASLTVDQTGNVLSRTSNWIQPDAATRQQLAKRAPEISCSQAVAAVAQKLQMPFDLQSLKETTNGKLTAVSGIANTDRVTCETKLYQPNGGQLTAVHAVTFANLNNHINVMVDKQTGQALGAADWVSHLAFDNLGRLKKRQAATFQYNVVPFGGFDLTTNAQRAVINPANPVASPKGWHDQGQGAQGITEGNNVIGTENIANLQSLNQVNQQGKRAQAADFNFKSTADDKTQNPQQYLDASITQAFFDTNAYHDIMFLYGFDEAAGNFQINNFSGKGQDQDPVFSLVQDGSGTNNANFASPPDGQPGVMRMFVFDRSNPGRDGAFENAVVIHELTHGLSNRLTGGPANANCLNTPEAGGMGEGWSDVVAMVFEMNAKNTGANTARAVGQYVTENANKGVRRFPYTTDLTVNPLTYADLATTQEVHNVGEIWASMLMEVYFNLVDKLGFDPNFKSDATAGKGNNVMLQLLVTGMKLQPCNPTFVQARDAINKADQTLFQGKNKCEIGKGFAKRGLGVNAVDGQFVNNADLPAGC
ncbi:Fungalysin metallopeptidase-domain-containing protein [Gorgonomyces haynaldii]|nr:Fungalysin metallopeptidase-domain-containing protein [Gorgonomyces haynaldii]